MTSIRPLRLLEPVDASHAVNVVVEVSKGSSSKFKYLPESGTFILHRSLPAGMVFPFDYGFIPSTLAEDGDPLDASVFIDTNAFPWCVVRTQLLGVMTATQRGGKDERVANDILLTAHVGAVSWRNVKKLGDISSDLLAIEFFFASYRNFQGKEFKAKAWVVPSTFGRAGAGDHPPRELVAFYFARRAVRFAGCRSQKAKGAQASPRRYSLGK